MLLPIAVLLVGINYNNAANILGFFVMPSRSHQILGDSIMNALAMQGHNVVMISPFSPNVRHKYEHIHLTRIMDIAEDVLLRNSLVKFDKGTLFEKLRMVKQVGVFDNCALNHSAVQSVLTSGRNFDFVLINYFGNDAFFGIANKLTATTVVFSPIGSSMFTNKITGHSSPYSYVPNKFLPLSDRMDFWERLINSVHYLLETYFPEAPKIQQLIDNVSLVLLNSQPNTETLRPYLPSMIQIGGFHINTNDKLPEEYQNLMDNAENGVILFSLGSNIKCSELPSQTMNAILKVISTIPQIFLWKFETDQNHTGFPRNLKVSNWLPQAGLLAHPNIKAFITHGGALSITEAIYHGVPMVAIPLFADQQSNVLEAVQNGFAVELELDKLNQHSFSVAIEEILGNHSYLRNVQRVSAIMKDQPIKPLDAAIYSIEYVLRHGAARHLKSASIELMWYQYYLLDVLCFIVVVLIILLILLRSLVYVSKRLYDILKCRYLLKTETIIKSKSS